MSFAPLYVVLLAALLGATAYVHRHASGVLGLAPRGRRVLGIVLAAGAAEIVVVRALRGVLPEPVVVPLGLAGSTLALALLFSAVLLGIIDLARLVATRAARLVARSGAAVEPVGAAPAPGASPLDPPRDAAPTAPVTRRAFLGQAAAGSAMFVGGSSSIYGALLGRHDYVIETVPVVVRGLSPALDGFTIVQLSDLHLGLFAGEREMAAAEDLVRKARPDLVVVTGDVVDFDPRHAAEAGRLARRLGALAREGVAAVVGNHDYYAGVDAVTEALRASGADVLVNRGRVVGGPRGGFALLGVDDVWARRMVPGGGPDLARALAYVPADLPRVLLCHNPVYFPDASGEIALQLSGHTHGGQINAIVRPAEWVLPHDYVAGLYRRGGAQLYVNRGFGTAGPPVRLGAPPEVTRIVLVAG